MIDAFSSRIIHAQTKTAFTGARLNVMTRAPCVDERSLSKQYAAFTVSNLGFFECDCMPFGLCNVPSTFQRLMQNCLRELNLTYCVIYLHVIIVFFQTVEEHLHCLCIVFDWFREHNLKLEQNHLPSSLNLEGWGLPQWLKSESSCSMCPATNIHQGRHFSQYGGPLQEVHQGVCAHLAAP